MTIFDKSKIKRPEILKIIEIREKSFSEVNNVFFGKHETPISDYLSIWDKIAKFNIRWLNGETVKGMLSLEEKRLQVKYLRFYLEYMANKRQQENPIQNNIKVKPVDARSVPAEWQIVPEANQERVMLYFHGGGHMVNSLNTHREFTVRLGQQTNMQVLSLDYRLAPEHPHPAALIDCVTSYKWLLSNGFKSKNILISGDSAGGYYTLLTLLKLRDEGEDLPAGAICYSPSTDLAQTGESVKKNSSLDMVLGDSGYIWWIYAHLDGLDPLSPSVSPLYAELEGLPPILIQASTSEMLFDDSRRFYKRAKDAGVDITLQTWDNTLHVFQMYPNLPETKEAMKKIQKFVSKVM